MMFFSPGSILCPVKAVYVTVRIAVEMTTMPTNDGDSDGDDDVHNDNDDDDISFKQMNGQATGNRHT